MEFRRGNQVFSKPTTLLIDFALSLNARGQQTSSNGSWRCDAGGYPVGSTFGVDCACANQWRHKKVVVSSKQSRLQGFALLQNYLAVSMAFQASWYLQRHESICYWRPLLFPAARWYVGLLAACLRPCWRIGKFWHTKMHWKIYGSSPNFLLLVGVWAIF